MSTFNLIDWLQQHNSSIDDIYVGDLFEHRVGFPVAQMVLDTTPPVGDIVINENISSGGIKIHEFTVLGSDDTELIPLRYVIADKYGNYLTAVESNSFGGNLDESKYQLIGYGDNYSIVTLFSGEETIKSVKIGATALKAKQYILEIQIVGFDKWLPIIMMIASQETRDFFQYDFSDESGITNVKAIRLRYKGDYYASLNTGNNITLTAFDKLTSLTGAQISHYADFSDSTSFPGADEEGWFDLTDGSNNFPWELVNNSTIWTEQSVVVGTSLQPLQKIFYVNNSLVAIGNTSTYVLSFSTNKMGIGYTFGATITCAMIHDGDNKLYIGLSNGKIYRSNDGINFGSELTDVSAPVTALINYQNVLYIGTNQTGIDDLAIIYTWDGVSKINLHYLEAPIVSCFAKANNYLYIGTSGPSAMKLGYVYRFNGNSEWSLSYNTGSDEVQALTYSPVNQKLWCAVNDGKIYNASFNSSGIPLWNSTAFYENESDHFYSIVTDTTKKTATALYDPAVNSYVWICSDGNFAAYINSAMKKQEYVNGQWQTVDTADVKFEAIQSPTGTIVNCVAYYNGELYGACVNGRIYKFDLSVIASTTRAVYVRLRDEAGNMSSLPSTDNFDSIYDTIVQDTDKNADGIRISDGHIYQIKYNPNEIDDKEIVGLYSSNLQGQGALLAPDRKVEAFGYYISPPFYVANLTNWDLITFLYNFPECTSGTDEGLNYGVSIDLYVKTANTRASLTSASWGVPHSTTTINVSSAAQSMVEGSFAINSLQGRWIQFYTVLTTASQAKTPELLNVSLFYKSSGSSYFFTSMIDTAKQVANYRNYIMNSDFEVGVWPWVAEGDHLQILTTTTSDNSRIGLIRATANAPTQSENISTSFKIEDNYCNKTFMISFWYQTDENYVTGNIFVRIEFDGGEDYQIEANTEGGIFKQYFTLPSDADIECSLGFYLEDLASAFEVKIDNIYVGPDYGSLSEDPAKFYRGLLTANTTVNDGDVVFAYTTEDGDATFDFNNSYTEIRPNRVFELDIPSSKIRFGILFTKTGTDPVVVHDFAVQLDAHDTDMRIMGLPQI